jgi:capsular polysaccharide biosynthesis protein
MNVAMAFIMGLMASVALILVLEFMDNTINNPEDVAQHIELPVMGVIPVANSKAGNYYGRI